MSGGSMDYLYRSVEHATFREGSPLRRAFREHLVKVARALRAIEWNDSGDGDSHEEELIRACIEPGLVLEHCKADAREALDALRKELERHD